jgi:hypothetical protein
MQLDDNVGRIAPQVPTIVNKSFELFASELMSKAAALAAKNGEKKLLASHLCARTSQRRCARTEQSLC